MLNFVFGRTGSGKTEYVFNNIKSLVDNGEKNIMLITPEQYSLIAERRILTELGVNGAAEVFNGSFSRISNDAKERYGSDLLPLLSKGAKSVLMLQAIENSKESLKLFSKNLDSMNFVNSMIKIYDEMRSCNLNSGEIHSLSKNIDNENLHLKMEDLSTIIGNYEKIISDRFLDPSDELTRLYNKIESKEYFKNKYVFIDGFNGFVAQEYKILELIISESKEVYITLCSDYEISENDNLSVFKYVNKSADIIKRIAEKAGVDINTIILTDNFRYKSKTLKHIEENIFTSTNTTACINDGSVSLYLAKNITDECNEASRCIRRLLREGYKASEISLIVRDIEKYRDELGFAFKKYDIPFFYDERQPIKAQPLVVLIEYLFRCVVYSLKSDDILSLAKTGLTELSDEEINELENYVHLWNINGSKWTRDFENSTKGFVDKISDDDYALLNSINCSRKKLITPILNFKKNIKNKSAMEICAQIYYTLLSFKADEKIKDTAKYYYDTNRQSLAMLQGRVWDIVMEVLNELSIILGDEIVSLDKFSKVFSMVISNEDLGVLPGGIDNVQLGQADRIRCDNPKVVLLLGANEGEFPQAVTSGGLLSEAERKILLDNDFKLYAYGEIFSYQERYFSYMALCCSSEKLFVSYIGNTGKESAPSEIVTSLEEIVNSIRKYTYDDINDIDLIETYRNSFELMSQRYTDNTVFVSSLKKVFENDEKYNYISDIAENRDVKIINSDISKKLFKYNMLLSASRIEDYFNCPFRYFCKFGLNVRVRNKTEIDALKKGTLIHYVLEMILSEHGSKGISEMPAEEIIKTVDQYIKQYFEEEMGNISDLPERFYYNYNRISNQIYNVVLHLALEFKESDFEAKAFELDIDSDGSVKPEVIKIKDGGSISVRGSIDRVDSYEENGKRYIRVVDYKSGGKKFDLSDIMYGLNLQMFIYLFCLSEDKTALLNGIPAGVLYMHANQKKASFSSRREAYDLINQNLEDRLRMMGVVISEYGDDHIPGAMEHNLDGKFIPVMRDKKGNLIGSLANLEELGRIHRKVNDLIAEMGLNLHNGNINRSPVKNKNHQNTCDFCDYKDVCASQRMIKERVVDDLTHDEIMKKLEEEYGSDA